MSLREFLPSYQKKKDSNELVSDVFQYDEIPDKLKITFEHIFCDLSEELTKVLVEDFRYSINTLSIKHEKLKKISDKFLKEIGKEHSIHIKRIKLLPSIRFTPTCSYSSLLNCLLENKNIDLGLDILRSLILIYEVNLKNTIEFQNFVQDINQRMLEHGFGYQFEDDRLIRVDSQYTHKEIVKPVLVLLQNDKFSNANSEYREAFALYSKGKYADTIKKSCDAFESVMKIICDEKQFTVTKNSASSLIDTLIKNNFIKEYNRSLLTGIATLRNQPGVAHGSGTNTNPVLQEDASYALHMSASNMLYLLKKFQNNS